MVLVPLKKTLTLYFARVCLYCSLRPLMYDMTTLAPFINFIVDGFGFLLGFCWGLPCWKNYVGKVIHFLCKEFRCRTYLFSSVDESVDNR